MLTYIIAVIAITPHITLKKEVSKKFHVNEDAKKPRQNYLS